MYGKQFYVKKQTRQSKSDPGPQRTTILPTRREFAGNPKFLHHVDAKITYFFPGRRQLRIYILEKLIEQLKKLGFFNDGKNDFEIKFMDMWTFSGII